MKIVSKLMKLGVISSFVLLLAACGANAVDTKPITDAAGQALSDATQQGNSSTQGSASADDDTSSVGDVSDDPGDAALDDIDFSD